MENISLIPRERFGEIVLVSSVSVHPVGRSSQFTIYMYTLQVGRLSLQCICTPCRQVVLVYSVYVHHVMQVGRLSLQCICTQCRQFVLVYSVSDTLHPVGRSSQFTVNLYILQVVRLSLQCIYTPCRQVVLVYSVSVLPAGGSYQSTAYLHTLSVGRLS